MSEIRICTDEERGDPSDIKICDEDSTLSPSDIRICEDEEPEDPCADPPTMSIASPSSTDLMVTGSKFTVSGGVLPISATYNGVGTISKTGDREWTYTEGTCSASGAPAGGTFTATDACGTEAEVDVRDTIVGASWVQTGFCFYGGGVGCTYSAGCGPSALGNFDEVFGSVRITGRTICIGCSLTGGPDIFTCGGKVADDCCSLSNTGDTLGYNAHTAAAALAARNLDEPCIPLSLSCPTVTSGCRRMSSRNATIYQWQCP